MSTPDVAPYLAAFDDAWSHPWESVEYAIKGLLREEAEWQHSSYANEKVIEGEQLPGSALWHIVHIEQCERQYLFMTLNRCKPSVDTPAHEQASDLTQMLLALQKTHNELRRAIAELTHTELAMVMSADEGSRYNGMPMTEFLHVAARHNAWHAGQIIVSRRLYRNRSI